MIKRETSFSIIRICLLSIMCINYTYSQSITELNFDFINKSWNGSLPESVDFGEYYQVKISNFNTLLYKVKDETSQRSLYIDPPSSFSSISLSGFINTSTQQTPVPKSSSSFLAIINDGTSKVWVPNNEVIVSALNFGSYSNLPSINSDQIKIKISEGEKFEILSEYPNFTDNPTISWNSNTYDGINDTLILDGNLITTETVDKYEAFFDRISPALMINNTQTPEEIEFNSSKMYFNNVKDVDTQILSLLSNCSNNYSDIRKEAIDIFTKLQDSNYTINNLNDSRTDLTGQDALDYEKLIIDVKEKIISVFEIISSQKERDIDPSDKLTIASARKYLIENKVKVLENNFRSINRENFTYYLSPQKVKADKLNIKFEIARLKPLTCPVKSPIIVEEDIKSKSKWPKISFSTGLFGLYGSNDFMSRQLSFIPTENQANMVQVFDANASSNLIPTIGGLMHASFRNKWNWSPAFSLGVSTTSGFDNVNIHLGPSLIIGRNSRVVLSWGWTARESIIADLNYPVGSLHLKDIIPDTVPSAKRFPNWGHYIGISINWTDPSKI